MLNQMGVATIGGGHGLYQMHRGLKDSVSWLAGIMTGGDGGSYSGVIAESLGMFPPGDPTRVLTASCPESELLRLISEARVCLPGQCTHGVRHIFLVQLWMDNGKDIQAACDKLGALLGAKARVIPVTLGPYILCVRATDNFVLRGEQMIDKGDLGNRTIDRVWIEGDPVANPVAGETIAAADITSLGAADHVTSLKAALLAPNIVPSVVNSPGLVVYTMNLMTKPGETHGYRPRDFIRSLRQVCPRFDLVLANCKPPSNEAAARARKLGSEPVLVDASIDRIDRIPVMSFPLLKETPQGEILHDPEAVRRAFEIIASSRMQLAKAA